MRAMLLQASVHPCPPGRGWESQAPAGPHFSRRRAGVTDPEAGDLTQLLCRAPPTCGPALRPFLPQHALVVTGVFCRCQGGLIPSSPRPSPAPMQAGGLCWGHFKPVLSFELGGKAQHLEPSAQPAGLAFCPWRWGWLFSGGGALDSRGSGENRGLVSCRLLSGIGGCPGSLKAVGSGGSPAREAPELRPSTAALGASRAAFLARITFSGAFLGG